MKKAVLLLALAVICAGGPILAQTTVFTVPMDQQINGAVYTTGDIPPNPEVSTSNFVSFEPASPPGEPDGWTRVHIADVGGSFYGWIDLVKAGIGPVGLSDLTKLFKLQVQLRYYQDPITNTDPYFDAPVFLRLYTYDQTDTNYVGYRDYDIIYSPWNGDPMYPNWALDTVWLNAPDSWPYTEGGSFNPAKVDRICFYGPDWYGLGDDYVDIKNVKLVWEYAPSTVSGLVRDSSGNPVPGAVVGIKSSPNAAADAERYATADGAGRYSVLIDSGTWYADAWSYGYSPGPDVGVTLAGRDVTQDLTIGPKAGADIAKGATVYATSEDTAGGFPAANGVDGDLGTLWATPDPLADTDQDQSYIIDLGSARDVTGVTICWENGYPGDYTVDVTTGDPNPSGNAAWTTVYSAAGATGGYESLYGLHFDPIRFDTVRQARGIRFHATAFSYMPAYSCYEFIVHGSGPSGFYSRISDLKSLPDNTPVEIAKTVSLSGIGTDFPDYYWYEEPDRSSGIRVEMPDHECYQGEYCLVQGTVQTDPDTGERYIRGSRVQHLGWSGMVFAPLAMCGRSLAQRFPQGLIVTAWGRVIELDPAGVGWFEISDGSATPVKVITSGPLPTLGAFVTVTGALGGGPMVYEF